MGNFAPIFLAFILNVIGFNIFISPKTPGCEPLISCLIFQFAVFLLLLEVNFYLPRLRELCVCGSYFIQFCVAAFIFDYTMCYFWFPLEASTVVFLTKLVEVEDDALSYIHLKKKGDHNFLKSGALQVFASYMLSIFFLVAVLHSTKYIDLRLLGRGGPVFLGDIIYRFKKYIRKMTKRNSCSDENSQNNEKMGNFLPIFMAFVLNLAEISIFVTPSTPGCEPVVSSLIFLLGLTILLLQTRLYSRKLQKICGWGTYFLEFFTATFILEYCMTYFWFLIEANLIVVIPRFLELFFSKSTPHTSEWKSSTNVNCHKLPAVYFLTSYLISSCFLLFILHRNNYIDLNLLRSGLPVFFEDIRARIMCFFFGDKKKNQDPIRDEVIYRYYNQASNNQIPRQINNSEVWDFANIYRPHKKRKRG